MGIGDDLDGCICTVRDVEVGRNNDVRHAEIARAKFLNGGQDDGVEGVTVVAQRKEDLEQVLGVAEFDRNRETRQRDIGSLYTDFMATTWPRRLVCVVVTSRGGEVELEMSR